MPAEQRMEWPTYAVSCTDEGGATVVAADKDDVFPGKFGPMWQESPALEEIGGAMKLTMQYGKREPVPVTGMKGS